MPPGGPCRVSGRKPSAQDNGFGGAWQASIQDARQTSEVGIVGRSSQGSLANVGRKLRANSAQWIHRGTMNSRSGPNGVSIGLEGCFPGGVVVRWDVV